MGDDLSSLWSASTFYTAEDDKAVTGHRTPKLSNNYQPELLRRHRSTVMLIRVLLALTIALSVAAFLGRSRFRQQENPALDIAVRITILVFGLGSVVLRRTRFST